MCGGVIPYQADIGKGTFITYHGLGVIINKRAVIGENCRIRQHVTIAANDEGVPVIGNNVQIGAGAVLIGKIVIGDNVKIGANAVVLHDLPSDCTAVGMPAKPVKFNYAVESSD
ncbi:MAG: serine acetyltransferase [Oscillospiraceae bacterium]|nr:serine acetyltransferase [Oscillospiraceae bacterium]